MEKRGGIVARDIKDRLLQPDRLDEVLASVLDRWHARAERRQEHIAGLNRRAAAPDLRLKRLYDAIESDMVDLSDLALKERIVGLKALNDRAQARCRAGTGHARKLRQSGGHAPPRCAASPT